LRRFSIFGRRPLSVSPHGPKQAAMLPLPLLQPWKYVRPELLWPTGKHSTNERVRNRPDSLGAEPAMKELGERFIA
jgi:hypothetical protein